MFFRSLLLLVFSGMVNSTMAASIATYEVRTGGNNAPQTMKVYLDKGYVMIKNAGNHNTDMLFRAADQTMFIISHERKSYIEMNPQIVQKTMQKVSGMMAILQSQLKNLPAAQRKKMEQMLGGVGGNNAKKQPVKLQKTGKTGRYAGIRCQWYVISSQEGRAQACFSSERAAGLSRAEIDTLRALYKFGEQMAKSASSVLGNNNPAAFMPKGGLPGVLLYSKETRGRTSEVKLLSVQHKAVANSFYRTPAGYSKMSMPGVGG
ncbi:MAG TPA: hypothetical protein ENI62_13940 [Gammaproteobacteria bacterium]|nr:hypothetical protein [Gammaproteobacteria bacterium]